MGVRPPCGASFGSPPAAGLAPEQIRTICSDMSPAYIKGVSEEFGGALLVFDYFHVVQLVSRALDQVRRRERREFPGELKGVRWAMLKGEDKLTDAERATRSRVCAGKLQTGKAFNHLDALRDIMKEPDPEAAARSLRWWCGWVGRSKIPEMKKAARTIRNHWDGIVAYLKTRVTNGAAEALNGIIQTVKRKARGFRTVEYFTAIIYLVASHLPDPVPITHTKSYEAENPTTPSSENGGTSIPANTQVDSIQNKRKSPVG